MDLARCIAVLLLNACLATKDVASPNEGIYCSGTDYNACTIETFTFYNISNWPVCLEVVTRTKVSFAKAQARCRMSESHLVNIIDSRVQSALQAILDHHYYFWIGLNYSSTKKEFLWSRDSETPVMLNHAVLRNVTTGDNQECVTFDPTTGLWLGSHCHTAHAFICESHEMRQFPKARPTLIVKSLNMLVGDAIEATCFGITEGTGTLSWQLETGNTSIHIFDGDARVESYFDYTASVGQCHKRLRSHLTVPGYVKPSDFFMVKKVKCALHQHGSRELPLCESDSSPTCATYTISNTTHANHNPWLKFFYHWREKKAFYWNQIAEIMCTSCVGLQGDVGFVQRYGDNMQLTSTASNETTQCGMNETIHVSIQVNDYAIGSQVACFSRNRTSGGPKKMSDWMYLNFAYAPQSPILHIQPGGESLYVPLSKVITARCKACVGNQGHIMWQLLNLDTQVELTAKQFTALRINIENQPKHQVPYCGLHAVSKLTLSVTSDLDKVAIVCTSQDYRQQKKTFSAMIRVRNLPLGVGDEFLPYSMYLFIGMTLLCLITLLMEAVWRYVTHRVDPQDDQDPSDIISHVDTYSISGSPNEESLVESKAGLWNPVQELLKTMILMPSWSPFTDTRENKANKDPMPNIKSSPHRSKFKSPRSPRQHTGLAKDEQSNRLWEWLEMQGNQLAMDLKTGHKTLDTLTKPELEELAQNLQKEMSKGKSIFPFMSKKDTNMDDWAKKVLSQIIEITTEKPPVDKEADRQEKKVD